jgi:CRP-like cAMP-binding protein
MQTHATAVLDPELLRPVVRQLAAGARRRLQPGARFLDAGAAATGFAYVERGLIESRLPKASGDDLIVERIGPGGICGEGPCLHGQPVQVEMVAVVPSELVVFSRELVERLSAEDPGFALALARIVALKYHRLLRRLAVAVEPRPAERVLELLRRLGVGGATGEVVVRPRLTHEEMAAMTGLSRVTVTRTLANLCAAGSVTRRGRDYLLPHGG